VKGRLLILLATLAMATGCAASKPMVMTPIAAEPDPWAGFTNGVKAEEKPEAKAMAEPTPSEAKPEAQADKVASADSTDEGTKPVSVKKAGKGKKAKRAGAVAGKKPRKRAKKQG